MNKVTFTLKKSLSFIFLVLILLSPLAVAQDDPTKFDPNNPALFDYQNGDYTTIDWSKVLWSRIPLEKIAEIPAKELQYQQLSNEQRLAMTSLQIEETLELIGNLAADVSQDAMREAIKRKKDVLIKELGSSAKIKNNIFTTEKGAFDFAEKLGWEIKVDKDGIIHVVNPKEIKELAVSKKDIFTISDQITLHSKQGSTAKVNGISFKDGQAYVKQGTTARVNDYEIIADKNPINIYFHTFVKSNGNYVAISDLGLDIGTTKAGEVKVKILPGNKLFSTVKWDYSTNPPTVIPSQHDTLTITAENGDSIQVLSRIDEGKTPLINHHDGNGQTTIESGRMNFRIDKGKLLITPPKAFEGSSGPIDMHNSVAFELTSDSKQMDNNILRTSSSNRFILLNQGKKIASNNMDLDVSNTIEANMMKSIKDLTAKYPAIKFDFAHDRDDGLSTPEDYEDITANMAQVVNQWLKDKPGIENYIHAINFGTENTAVGSLFDMGVGERLIEQAGIETIREENNAFDILNHEFIHVLDFIIENKEHILQNAQPNAEAQNSNEELHQKYLKYSISFAKTVYTDSKFTELINKLTDLQEQNKLQEPNQERDFNYKALYIDNKDNDGYIELKADVLRQLEQDIKDLDKSNNPLIKQKAQTLLSQFQTIVKEKGLYTHSLNPIELSATYSELPPEKAKLHPELAQLEYDRVMSINPPSWFKQKAEQRYYVIMGDSCKIKPCGPCLLYTLLCKK